MLHSVKSLLCQQIISINLDYINDMGSNYDNNPIVSVNKDYQLFYKKRLVTHFIFSDEAIYLCVYDNEGVERSVDFYEKIELDVYKLIQ